MRTVLIHVPLAGLATTLLLLTGCFGSSASTSSDSGAPGQDSGMIVSADGGADGSQDTGTADATGDGSMDAPAATGTFSTSTVDLGLATCGGAQASKSYTFTNSGPIPIVWSATVDPAFSIEGASSGTVAPGAMGTLMIDASVPATATAGTAITGNLTITTNVPGFGTVIVPLQITPQGGSLVVSGTTGFGSVTVGQPATQAFTLQNVGNAGVSVGLGTPSDNEFAFTYSGAPSAASIGGGGSLAGAKGTFTPTSSGVKTTTVPLTVTGALCASPATSLSFSGTGTTAPVTIGPSPLSFNTVYCGQTAASQPITLTNTNGVGLAYTTSLGLGASSNYTLDAPTGTVPANGQFVINVSPAAIPVSANLTPGAYDDTLSITVTGFPPVTIPLQESAGGAILSVSMPSTNFGTFDCKGSGSLPFTVTNTGNVDAPLTVSAPGAGFGASFTIVNTATANGGQAPGKATFSSSTRGTFNAQMTVTSTVPQCGPPQVPMLLSATIVCG